MSLMELSALTDEETIAHYIMEHSPRGLQLAYDDYPIIRWWLTLTTCDQLLYVLSQVLGERKPLKTGVVLRPKSLNRSVVSRIKKLT